VRHAVRRVGATSRRVEEASTSNLDRSSGASESLSRGVKHRGVSISRSPGHVCTVSAHLVHRGAGVREYLLAGMPSGDSRSGGLAPGSPIARRDRDGRRRADSGRGCDARDLTSTARRPPPGVWVRHGV
jgi:hypothetical protein